MEVTDNAGPGLGVSRVSRGASFADYDADGDVDIFVLNLNALPTLMRNDSDRGRYLVVRLVGEESNRDGIGASVSIGLGDRQQHAEVRSGTSYLSHNDMRLHFGVGQAEQVDWLRVDWPSGRKQEMRNLAVNQEIIVREEGN